MKMWMALVGLVLACPGIACAQYGYSITGGLSNFDCGNHCDDPCDEFEIEIEGIRPEDVVHTYRNGNYGSPTVTLSESGASTIIDYRHPNHSTAVNAIEHFGVSVRQLNSLNYIHVRWMRNGLPATVNGQVPMPGGGSAPATQPMLPSITADMGVGSLGQDGITLTVINNDTTQGIWIRRRAQVSQGVVTLEQLMPNDPVVTSTIILDSTPRFLPAGGSITITSDLVEVEDNQSAVFAAEYFQDIFVGGPFNPSHAVGPSLGNVMTASIASPGTGCDMQAPVITVQPVSTDAAEGRGVDLRMSADSGEDLPITFQWMKDGVPIQAGNGFSGVTGDELTIDALSAEFEGFYSVMVTNACGSVVSDSALVFITGHNVPPPRPIQCPADFDHSGTVNSQDFFEYINAFFALSASADFNGDADVNSQDFFDFLNAFFAGC